MPDQSQTDLLLIIATIKSLHEQLYNLKGVHSQRTKQYFNILLTTAKRYEKEVDKMLGAEEVEAVNALYDAMTEAHYIVKDGILKEK